MDKSDRKKCVLVICKYIMTLKRLGYVRINPPCHNKFSSKKIAGLPFLRQPGYLLQTRSFPSLSLDKFGFLSYQLSWNSMPNLLWYLPISQCNSVVLSRAIFNKITGNISNTAPLKVKIYMVRRVSHLGGADMMAASVRTENDQKKKWDVGCILHCVAET